MSMLPEEALAFISLAKFEYYTFVLPEEEFAFKSPVKPRSFLLPEELEVFVFSVVSPVAFKLPELLAWLNSFAETLSKLVPPELVAQSNLSSLRFLTFKLPEEEDSFKLLP